MDPVNYLESNYTNFSAPKFCKDFSLTRKMQAVSKFESAVNEIGRRNLRSKDSNKALINWARVFKKDTVIEMFSTVTMSQYFYDQTRKLLLLKAKNSHLRTQLLAMEDMEADIQSQSDSTNNNSTTTTDNEDNNSNIRLSDNHTSNSNTSNNVMASTSNTSISDHNLNDQNYEAADNMIYMQSLRKQFQEEYMKMEDSKKWYLSTRKCVEDEMFCFGMQCKAEHQSHSFIIDPSDENWKKFNVFSQEELDEMEMYQTKQMPTMPIPLRDYLNSFNLNNTARIRSKVFTPMQFDNNYNSEENYDFDWVRNSIYNLLLEYEAESLNTPHQEEWFKTHVWNFNDTVFNQSKIEVARGEVASSASSTRKNKDRTCQAIDNNRKRTGTKCDMLFRDRRFTNEAAREYGASETGAKYEGESGTKLLDESYLKLPKTLKDMLDNLFRHYPHASPNDLETVGYVHAGLYSQVLRVDRPSTYTTRVTRLEPSCISSDVNNFGASVLPALYISYIVREMMLSVQSACDASLVETTPVNDSSWLEGCVKRKHPESALSPSPRTSTSDETKRRKNEFHGIYYFRILADALLLGHLPRLQFTQPPDHPADTNDYSTCVMLLKDRLVNLKITDATEQGDYLGFIVRNSDPVQFYRLFNQLDRFKNLTQLHIEKESGNIFDLIETVTSVCPLLSNLGLYVDPIEDSQPSVVDKNSTITPHLIPMQLFFFKNILHDSQLVSYIIDKFPYTEQMLILGRPKQISRLNESTLNKFFTFLANVNLIQIDYIPFIEQLVIDFIGPFWSYLSEFCTLSVEIKYDSRPLAMDDLCMESTYGPGIFKFAYASSDTGLKHIRILQEYGHYIDNLTLSGIGIIASQQLDKSLYETLIIDPLKHCAKLKQLTIQSCTLSGSEVSNCNTFTKQTFDDLRIIECTFKDDKFFENLSATFTHIKYLEFSEIKHTNNFQIDDTPVMNIDLSKTEIDTLVLLMDPPLSFRSGKAAILARFTIGTQFYYEIFLVDEDQNLKHGRISEEMFHDKRYQGFSLIIGVKCKSLGQLLLKNKQKEVSLTLS